MLKDDVALQFPLPDNSQLRAFNWGDRFTYFSLVTLATFTLLTARLLKPAAQGFGTHEQLGLPPCAFFKWTGIPCPNCGLTTSFAHSARLHFFRALITQPFGVLAFCLMLASIPFFIFLVRRRIAWSEFILAPNLDRLIYCLLGFYLLSWLYKIAAVKLLFL
ncbi:MAG: DUF2752 domain-containing protein [Acidobacteria bacterium]|nr:DUF2752 domain-containing protein [Acidobacteriota bacterium]